MGDCFYQLGALDCFTSRVIVSLVVTILLILLGIGATIGLKMLVDWVTGDIVATRPTPPPSGYPLRRINHLNLAGMLDTQEDGMLDTQEDGIYSVLDLPPSYEEATRSDFMLPPYQSVQGLNRVLPGREVYGRTWVV